MENINVKFSEDKIEKLEKADVDIHNVSGGSGGDPIGVVKDVEESEKDVSYTWGTGIPSKTSNFSLPPWVLGGDHPDLVDLRQNIKEKYSVDNNYLDGVIEVLHDEWGSYSGKEIERAAGVMISNDIHPDALAVLKILSQYELQTVKKNGVLINDVDGALIIEDKRGMKEIARTEREALDDVIYGSGSSAADLVKHYGSSPVTTSRKNFDDKTGSSMYESTKTAWNSLYGSTKR